MEMSRAERLEQAVTTLSDLVALTRSLGLSDSAQFLAMARLNLLIDLNGITEPEFRSFCVALEGEAAGQRRTSPLARSARRRRAKSAQGEEPASGRMRRGAEPASRHASRTRLKR
jgi:hypothetical protein